MTTATIAPLNKDFCKAPCKPSQHCWTTTPSIGCGRIRELILVLNQVLRFSVPLGIQNTIKFTLEKCQHWCYTVFLKCDRNHYWVLHASFCRLCCVLLGVVARSLKMVKFLSRSSQLFQHYLITYGLHGDTHALTKLTKFYGWYPSHNTLHVLTLLRNVASFYTPLPTLCNI